MVSWIDLSPLVRSLEQRERNGNLEFRGDNTMDNCLSQAIGMRGMLKVDYRRRRQREDILPR